MNKIFPLLILVFILTFSATAFSQVRGEFEPIVDGFSIAKAIESNGKHSLLVKFPEEYLVDGDKINAGIEKIVPVIFGCEFWPPDCKAKITKHVLNKEGRVSYAYMDIVIGKTPTRILIFGLAEDAQNKQFSGVVLMMESSPKIILD